MIPLIDLDILLYEIGFGAEYDGDVVSFDTASQRFDFKIQEITDAVKGDRPPILYYTGKNNFRNEISKKRKYKGNREDAKKPFHYDNLKYYAIASYDCQMVEGLEADDLLCIKQTSHLKSGKKDTVICSRDKDLRQCDGWHYSWECGRQPEMPLYFVEGLGELKLSSKKIKGNGLKFFYSQILTGDVVDNIEGLAGYGIVKTYNLLNDAEDEKELYRRCLLAYEEKYPENASEELLEQARLVWMVRELDSDGNPIMWFPPIISE